jgi:hypothetical protein
MEIRRQFDKKNRSPGEASVRHIANGNSFAQVLDGASAAQAMAGDVRCQFTASMNQKA